MDDNSAKTALSKMVKSVASSSILISLIFLAAIALIFSIFFFGQYSVHSNSRVADLLNTVGIGILAALVTTIVDRTVSARDLEARISRDFREAAGVAASLTELGIQCAHPRLDFGLIFHEARRGETVSWLDTQCPSPNEFIDELKAALSRGVRVRMLIINPNCANAQFRAEELEGTIDAGDGFSTGLSSFICKMTALANSSQGKLEIRYYSDLPCVPMYLVGKAPGARKAFFSIFLARGTNECQHVELGRGEWLNNMAKYFEAKWSRQAVGAKSPVALMRPGSTRGSGYQVGLTGESVRSRPEQTEGADASRRTLPGNWWSH